MWILSQTPVASGSKSFRCFPPLTIRASSSTGIFVSPSEPLPVLRDDGDASVRRQQVRQQPVAFVQAVVVVRNRFARRDRAVLGSGGVRCDSTE